MVRHQLPLHGAGVHQGPAIHSRFAKPSTNIGRPRRSAIQTRPVLLGPVTFLKLGKSKDAGVRSAVAADRLLPVYIEVLRRACQPGRRMGADRRAVPRARSRRCDAQQALHCDHTSSSRGALPQLKIMLTTYFGGLGDNLDTALSLPVAGLHLDLVRAPEQLDALAKGAAGSGPVARRDRRPQHLARRSAGCSTGWSRGRKRGTDRVQLAPSCSLLHVPIDVALETDLDAELKSWLAFAVQKMGELAMLGQRAGRRPRHRRRCLRSLGRRGRRAQDLAAGPRREGRQARVAAVDAGHAPAREPVRQRADVQQRALRPAGVPDHHDRFVPADRRSAKARARARQGRTERRRLRDIPAGGDRRGRSAGRKTSASTCSCTASSSATTWSSISASSSPDLPSPGTAGCNATARAASGRRSCSATYRARSR